MSASSVLLATEIAWRVDAGDACCAWHGSVNAVHDRKEAKAQ
jgi:hypothetical protein